MCLLVEMGGLGIRSVVSFNQSFIREMVVEIWA